MFDPVTGRVLNPDLDTYVTSYDPTDPDAERLREEFRAEIERARKLGEIARRNDRARRGVRG